MKKHIVTIEELTNTEMSRSLIAQASLVNGHKSLNQLTFVDPKNPDYVKVIYKIWIVDKDVLETDKLTEAIELYNSH